MHKLSTVNNQDSSGKLWVVNVEVPGSNAVGFRLFFGFFFAILITRLGKAILSNALQPSSY